MPYVSKFCLGFAKEAFAHLAGFDERHFPNDVLIEVDLAFRAVESGFVVVLCPDTYVYDESGIYPLTSDELAKMGASRQFLSTRFGTLRFNRAQKTLAYHPLLSELRQKVQLVLQHSN